MLNFKMYIILFVFLKILINFYKFSNFFLFNFKGKRDKDIVGTFEENREILHATELKQYNQTEDAQQIRLL